VTIERAPVRSAIRAIAVARCRPALGRVHRRWSAMLSTLFSPTISTSGKEVAPEM
jgi:hypothetical protein